ncbi:bifunctional diguanylate cyclase/phosphodiesterase [Undibacterium fentianense]|uniref:EAL domain-containing protein n=1 Tax=Undibacterium fentianense TaxID=2828728 RepID=A0A941DZ13_9BURK|nr:bifunctional diguanylate cyclase/phosphodiesterase [Undibacterium fentianense]MBR7800079.1 EAL domain-containing protein [Undibacterium fentianense]
MPNSLLHLAQLINDRSLHHIFPEGLLLLSASGKLTQLNLAAREMLQADPVQEIDAAHELNDLKEWEFVDLLTSTSRTVFLAALPTLIEGQRQILELEYRGWQGNLGWAEFKFCPILDLDKNLIGIFVIARDISNQKEIALSLQQSEQQFRTLIEIIPQQIWTADALGNLTFANQRTLEYFGVRLDQITGLAWESLVHPDDRQHVVQRWRHSIATGAAYEVEFRLRRVDGAYRWHIGLALPLRDQHDQIQQWFGSSTDINVSKQNEVALRESERNLAAAQARAKMGSWQRDLITQNTVWSAELYRILGFTPGLNTPGIEEVQAKVFAEDRDAFAKMYEEYLLGGSKQLDFRYPGKNGDWIWIEAKSETFYDGAGNAIALTGTVQDITERKQLETAIATSRQLLAECQSIAQIGGWEIDLRSRKLTWTDETYRIHDTTPQEFNPSVEAGLDFFVPASRQLIEEALQRAINLGEPYDLELEKITLKGRRIIVRTTCNVSMHDGKAIRLTGIFQDITEQKAAQLALKNAYAELEHSNSMLEHIAHYDALTHLPNRVLLADRMQQAMLQCQRRGNSLAVAFLDLDGFKSVNDVYGHSVGDELLIQIAARLRAALREGDTLARLGGDEFVAILSDLERSQDCEPVLARLLLAASEPIELHHAKLQVSASIGVTIYPQDGVDAEQLLRHADQAMYLSKQTGKNCYHLFDVAQDAAIKVQRDDLTQIQMALIHQEFVLYYQPKVNMRTGQVFGVEALIRWQHPAKGLLPPASFLPTIENHAFSIELGEWVMATAMAQIAHWQTLGLDLAVSVNVGALQLQQADFTQRLEKLLAPYPRFLLERLELEILESSALSDIEQVTRVIERCQSLGICFALDDFGTGYSSLRYLKQLPAQILKIDQSFVRDMLEDDGDLTIIKGVIGLASAFHRCVIAEGVETLQHGEKLLSIGCEKAQGYGIAKPMPAQEIPIWIQQWTVRFAEKGMHG